MDGNTVFFFFVLVFENKEKGAMVLFWKCAGVVLRFCVNNKVCW